MIEVPDWLDLAIGEGLRGVAEIPGAAHNARILAYHATTTLHATADEVPWCAAGACWCLEGAGWRSPRSAAARDFLDWGVALAAPAYGCVVVLARGPRPWPGIDVPVPPPPAPTPPGHVAFHIATVSPAEVLLYGGNQRDTWVPQCYPSEAILGLRWPADRIGG